MLYRWLHFFLSDPKGRNVGIEKAFGAPRTTKVGVSVATENDLADKIGMRVILNNKKNNSGTLTIQYKDIDQLDRLIKVIKSNYW